MWPTRTSIRNRLGLLMLARLSCIYICLYPQPCITTKRKQYKEVFNRTDKVLWPSHRFVSCQVTREFRRRRQRKSIRFEEPASRSLRACTVACKINLLACLLASFALRMCEILGDLIWGSKANNCWFLNWLDQNHPGTVRV